MASKKLVLVGGGGHCKSVLDSALRSKEYSEIVITDSNIQVGTDIYGCTVVGDDEILPVLREKEFNYAFITLGSIMDASLRNKLAYKVEMLGFAFPVIIDPSAVVSDYASIGEGTYIGKGAVINADAVVGRHCIINTGAIIEHECHVGDFTHVSIDAVLCGQVHVGEFCMVGANSTVLQCIDIPNCCVVAAGETIRRNFKVKLKRDIKILWGGGLIFESFSACDGDVA